MNIFIAFGIILSFGSLFTSARLHCYKCINWSCSESELFCKSVKAFAFSKLNSYYYNVNDYPECPKDTLQDWEFFKKSPPSSIACEYIGEDEATCALGRIEVISELLFNEDGTRSIVSSYATVMGCAKRELIIATKESIQLHPTKCALLTFNSTLTITSTIRHYGSVEFCPTRSDMCHKTDYCISPRESVVKPFKQDADSDQPQFPIWIFIGVALGLGSLICILTFCGIKYS